ncbi:MULTISPECIES: helix-turn-helix domain-containing protein [Rhizobium]|uniref:helix-turn-helix domain-containing protein n=1 Tax=Rhizobium TaxID=379 RepID=UPI001EF066A5|nr:MULTISPECIES: helix-turn-helix domain-containing protein [Rhizobium]
MALPQLHTMDSVAEALHVSRRTLQDIIKDKPFYRQVGRRKIFTDADIQALLESLSCHLNSSRPAGTEALTSTSVAPSEASLLTKLQALTTGKGRKKSASVEKTRSSTVVSMASERRRRSSKPA